MTLSNSLMSYQDCLEAMDQAMEDPKGGRVRFDTQSAALAFHARCHQARKLDREKNCLVYEDPAHPQHNSSAYDILVLREKTDGENWYIYLEKLDPTSIEVEPLSEAPQITHVPIKRLPAPDT